MIKQVIVLRREYPDGKGGIFRPRFGKLISSACHASMKVFADKIWQTDGGTVKWVIDLDENMEKWLGGLFTKIVVYVNSEKELIDLYVEAQLLGLPHALIQDSGLTEFRGKPTYTCLAIGPEKSEDIDRITGHLALL